MKKILAVFLTAILLTFAPLNAVCVENPEYTPAGTYETSSTTVYFEDGSYMGNRNQTISNYKLHKIHKVRDIYKSGRENCKSL